MKAALTDEAFVGMFERMGGNAMARDLGMNLRALYRRRERLEKKLNRSIVAPDELQGKRVATDDHPARQLLDIRNGIVLVGSDAHYWPEVVSTAHRAFVRFAEELRPKAIVMNGDALDGCTISRHPPIGWEGRPTLVAEVEATKTRLAEIRDACPSAKRIWTLGNHDGRFETRLATVAPEYARLHGVHLKDHFPEWTPAWSAWINNNVVIKHRFKGGIHATHNNTVTAGKTLVTGHLHSLKVTPFTDYNGTRYGVDCGTMAEPYGPQFNDYMEDNPRNWRQGFVVLTFKDGRLLWPEVVHVLDSDTVEFRGNIYTV